MADSTTNIDQISQSQSQKEATANQYFDAASPAALFGRRGSATAGTTWAYYGGKILVNGTPTDIANGTVTLTLSATNYVEATLAGTVSVNTTAFTAGRIPLYTIVVGASTVTSYTDHRVTNFPVYGRLVKSVAGSSNVTLTAAEARNQSFEFTGTLTGSINVIVPAVAWPLSIYNGTAGAFTLTVKTSAGSGIAVAQTKRAVLECDGTNVVRVTADV